MPITSTSGSTQLGYQLQPDLGLAARHQHADAPVGSAGGELDLRRHLGGDAELLEHADDVGRGTPPPAGAVWPMDFAASSARRSASADDTSGLGAPLRTAMPMPVRATSVRPSAILPCPMSSSSTLLSTTTRSALSPALKRRASPPEGP